MGLSHYPGARARRGLTLRAQLPHSRHHSSRTRQQASTQRRRVAVTKATSGRGARRGPGRLARWAGHLHRVVRVPRYSYMVFNAEFIVTLCEHSGPASERPGGRSAFMS
jgi:hypothetical protein